MRASIPSNRMRYFTCIKMDSLTRAKVGGFRELHIPLNPDTVSISLFEETRNNCRLITHIAHQRRILLDEFRHIN